MKRKQTIPDVPAEEPEEESHPDVLELEPDLDQEPVPVLIVDTEEAEPPLDAELEPDIGAVLPGDTYDTGEPGVVEVDLPPFLEANRVDEPEIEVDWVAPPIAEEAVPEVDDLVDEMAIEAGEPDMGPEPVFASPLPEPEPVVAEPVSPPPPPSRPTRPASWDTAPRRSGVGWGSVLAIGLLSAIAGAALALLVLFALNGSLIYPRNRDRAQDQDIAALAERLSRVDTQLGTVNGRLGEVEDLNTRVDDVEGRVGTLGGDLNTLQGDVAGALDEVGAVQEHLEAVATRTVALDEELTAMSAEVTDIGEQIGLLEEVARRFDLFVAGLRNLLDQADAAPEGEVLTPMPLATGSFTATPLPTSTTQATATPRADVTVIPLATPTP